MKLNYGSLGLVMGAGICGACVLASGCGRRERHVTVIEQRPAPVVVELHGPVIVSTGMPRRRWW
jgi:hypothetical protein